LDIPAISTQEMIEVDRVMVEELGIGLIQMMELAGDNLASLARSRFLHGDVRGKKVTVLAGSGANGGGVLTAARHLHNRGAYIRIYTVRAAGEMRKATLTQFNTLRKLNVEIFALALPPLDEATDLILDGIIGYNLKGAPWGFAVDLIHWANADNAPVLSMDVPSGLDATGGVVFEPAIRAAATMALALPKTGLDTATARAVAGELYLADIGVPPEVYKRFGIGIDVANIFSNGSIIRLR